MWSGVLPLMMRFAPLAFLLLSLPSLAGSSRVVQFDFSARLAGREPSTGTVATLVDEKRPATIRVTDEQGQVHELAFTVRGAGRRLELQATMDGKPMRSTIAPTPGARVVCGGADGSSVELTLVHLR